MPELLALGEQQLIAEADPEIRPSPAGDVGADRLGEPEPLEARHRVAERAIPGHDQRPAARHRARVLA